MVTHPLTTTSNIVLSRSHTTNTKDWHPSNKVMSTPLKSCESSHWCSMITINVLWKSTHSIITSHSASSHKITISNHPDSLKSCAMTQIWMLHDNLSASAISWSNQTTLSSWSIYHLAKLNSSLTSRALPGQIKENMEKNRQWYCSMLTWTTMVRSYNGTNVWCHVRLKMGRSSSLQSQDMDIAMVLLWS